MAKNETLKKLDVEELEGVSGGINVYSFVAEDGKKRYFIPGKKTPVRYLWQYFNRRGISLREVHRIAMGSEAEARAAAERELLQMRIAAKRPRLG